MKNPAPDRLRYLFPLALAFVFAVAFLVYLPGLASGLYIDDYYNLHLLTTVKERGMLAFAGSGISGPLGRPLSYLSFALQAGSWPDNIAAFKLVNLLLHLCNGVLVLMLCRACAPYVGLAPREQGTWCLFAVALWLVHPMHLTTVLYVVQRMTELSALFVLLGIIGYLRGRRALEDGRLRAGYTAMSLAVAGGTAAAALAKENGILLPVFILVLDQTLLQSRSRPAGYARWSLVFLVLPAGLVGLWLIWQAWGFPNAFQWRPYSMYQKSLTEAGVLLVYAWNLLLPRPSAFGLFHDDFPVVSSLLEPAWAMPAAAVIAALVAGAVGLRRRHPVPAFCVLWFLAGHVLESTHLNLAIYFEHRNYLPSLGLLALVPWLLLRCARTSNSTATAVAALCVYTGLIAWVGVQNSLLWRQPLQQAEETARVHPDSRWAMAQLGSRYIGAGRIDAARALYERLAVRYPAAILPWLRLAAIPGCILNRPVPEQVWGRLAQVAETGEGAGFEFLAELNTQISVIGAGECRGAYARRLAAAVELMTTNPNLAQERGTLHELAGALRLTLGDIPATERHLRLAREIAPTLHRRWLYIDLLLNLGRQREAREEIAGLRAALRRKPFAWLAYHERLDAAERRLSADADPGVGR